MFRIPATVQKYSKRGNTLIIKGIATAPTIDRDNERMTPAAIEKMAASVNLGKIPIRVEHEDKFYTDIGIWKNATINSDGHMEVEGEVDTDLSLGKDLEVMLNKGAKIGMSIGGKVVDAALTFEANIGKSVRDYKDILLREITITKNPAVSESCVSIAKSVTIDDQGKVTETAEAVSLSESLEKKFNNQHEVISSEIQKAWHEKNIAYIQKMAPTMSRPNPNTNFTERKMLTGWPAFSDKANSGTKAVTKSFDKAVEETDALMKTVQVEKDYDAEVCFDGYAVQAGLTSSDLDTIVKIAYIISEVNLKEQGTPKAFLNKDGYWNYDFMDSLPAECFVVELTGRWFPHHNADFSVNMEWVKYYLFQLISGNYSWLTPKEYVVALCHLYQHYKMDALKKSAKPEAKAETEVTKAHVSALNADDTRATFSEEAMGLLYKCYLFQVNKTGSRPQYTDDKGVLNDLGDKEIKKFASAYAAMMQDKNRRGSLGMMMAGTYRNSIAPAQSKPSHGLDVKKSTSSQSDDMAKTPEELEKEANEAKEAADEVEKKKKDEKKDDEAKKTEEVKADAVVEKTEDEKKAEEAAAADEVEKAKKKKEEDEETEKKKKKATDEEAMEKTKQEEANKKSTEVAKTAEGEDAAKDGAKASDTAPSASETKAGESTAEVTKTATDTGESKDSGETVTEETADVDKAKAQEAKDLEKSKEEASAAMEAVAKKAAENALKEAVEKSIAPAMEKLTNLVTALQTTVEKSQEDVKKSVKQTEDARAEELEEVKKTVVGLTKVVTKIGQLPNVRKSVAAESSFSDLQKKFSEGDNAGGQADVEKAVDTYLKDHPGCPVHVAYAEVKKAMIAESNR